MGGFSPKHQFPRLLRCGLSMCVCCWRGDLSHMRQQERREGLEKRQADLAAARHEVASLTTDLAMKSTAHRDQQAKRVLLEAEARHDDAVLVAGQAVLVCRV